MTQSSNRTGLSSMRPTLSHLTLNIIVATYLLGLLNLGFWSRLMDQFPEAPLKAAVYGLAVWALTLLTLELLGPWRLQKPMAALLIIIAASAQYYERNLGVLIDRDMVRNILETTPNEGRHLITPNMVIAITLSGVFPAILVFWPRVKRRRIVHQLWRWPLGVALAGLVMIGALFSNYKDYSAMLRAGGDDLMGAYQPGASLVAVSKFVREEWKTADPLTAPFGRDAVAGPHLAAAEKPVLLVFFVGETVRAQDFGLDGYARDTTPGLRQRDVINFTQATSCGTSTAVSVPCMFSHLTKADYSREGFLGNEDLLDVLSGAGIDTQWWDNNTGDQNVARRTGWTQIDATIDAAACKIECTDDAFLPVIANTLAGITGNTVLVFHMIGSHGPSYYLRYAAEQAEFQPTCQTSQFSDCTSEEIVNAYDNSILETDHVLSRAIDMLAASDRVTPALIYVSDHGESLGENGLYLHAAPTFMAPAEQTRVPFLMWLSPAFTKTMALDKTCLVAKGDDPVSHDNVFHTVLGLMNIDTAVRDPALDLTATCRTKDPA